MANAFASELNYEVAERRRRLNELTTPLLHERFGTSHLIQKQIPVLRLGYLKETELDGAALAADVNDTPVAADRRVRR